MVNLLDEKELPTESDAMSIGFLRTGEDFFTLKGSRRRAAAEAGNT